MTRIIDTQKARRKTPVRISNKNTQMETTENRTMVDEAIDWLSTLPLTIKDGAKAKLITDMAIQALMQPPNDDWERYADHLWKEAYERGKKDALKDKPQGEWVKAVDDGVWSFTDAYAECDQCHKVTFNGWNMDYCPKCGADMRGENNECK